MKVKRLTEEQLLERVNYLWKNFSMRPEMNGVSYEQFKNDCFVEYKKQCKMSDDDLKKYREKSYNDIIDEVNLLTTQEEKQKLIEQDNKTIDDLEEHIIMENH